MGNSGIYPSKPQNQDICISCWGLPTLDRDELALHKIAGVPRGRICPRAMQCLEKPQHELLRACASENPELIKMYMEQGVSPFTFDENRTSPLHIAARYGSFGVVEELVKQGCSLDITDCAGWTCLHIASYMRKPEVVRILLESGADATIINTRGETPYDLAKDEACKKVFKEYWHTQTSENKCKNADSPEAGHSSSIIPHQAFPRPHSPLPSARSKPKQQWLPRGQWPVLPMLNRKILIERGRRIFNWNPCKALAFFAVIGAMPQSNRDISEFVFSLRGRNVTMTGELLGRKENGEILRCFLELLNCRQMELVEAVTQLLKHIALPRDGMMADQIIEAFADYYWHEEGPFISKDSVHHLVFSVIMLDFSLHNSTSSPLTLEDFVRSNAGMHGGENFPHTFLSWIYQQIKRKSLRTGKASPPEKLFDGRTVSGFLAYRIGNEWKERYFVLRDSVLWSFFNANQMTPHAILPVLDMIVSFDTRLLGFSLSCPKGFSIVKFNEEGNVRIQTVKLMKFKAGNLNQWFEAFKNLPGITFLMK